MPDHYRRQRAGKALARRVVFELTVVSLAHDVASATQEITNEDYGY